jgi:alkyldihydroxyacetonephosphate synthase
MPAKPLNDSVAPGRRRSFWGWGYEDEQLSPAELRSAAAGLVAHLGFGSADVELPVALEDVELPPARLEAPAALAEICSAGLYDRAAHAYGKAYRDVVRGFRGRFDHAPDVVAHPRDEAEVEAVLAWCADASAAAIPVGGGTSVVGGVEAAVGDRYEGAVAVDLKRLDRVLEVDRVSRAARIQAGATGPSLEDQLRPHGLTLRHFPQSFELSTLGGWIATRAGGHFATLYTHIDDLVESVRAVTPAGVYESRRLPGSGAGPSPDRLLLGSEGILGVITEAWVRLQDRPTFKASAGVQFADFGAGAEAVRALSQSGLYPTNCRLLDPAEAALTGAARPSAERVSPTGDALLVLGFESADHPVDAWIERALELAADFGGRTTADRRQSGDRAAGGTDAGKDAVGSWRQAFLRAPYLRDVFVAAGIISDTFETAITWDRFPAFHESVMGATVDAVEEVCGGGRVMCRFTHVYPDGPAPYFTVLAPARRGAELEQWDEIKRRAAGAVIAGGGTITHHHAVGRDHRPWYDRQRPEPFAKALRAAKAALDPGAILNPGVLVDPVAPV